MVNKNKRGLDTISNNWCISRMQFIYTEKILQFICLLWRILAVAQIQILWDAISLDKPTKLKIYV